MHVIYKNTYDKKVTKIDYCIRQQQWNYMQNSQVHPHRLHSFSDMAR
jgi:hypothetical protein